MDIYGFGDARHGLPVRPERPELVRRPAADEAAVLRERVRRGRPVLRRRAAEPLRRQGLHAHRASASSRRSSSSSCSAPASTPARRPSGCATPRASSASSARARPGARSWTSTCSPTRSSTGARTAWCSSATCSCAGCRSRGRLAPRRSPSSGRARAATRACYAGRIELQDVKGRFPLPDLSAEFRYATGWGHVQVAGIAPPDEVGRPRRRRSSTCRATRPAGASTSARTSSSAEARGAAAGRLRRGHRELHERRAGRRRASRTTSRQPADPRPGRGPARPRHRRVLRPQLERQVDEHRRLLAGRHRQQRRPGRRRVQEGPVRARQPPLLPGQERDARAGDPVGQAGEQFRDGFTSDDVRVQFSVKYNFTLSFGGKS